MEKTLSKHGKYWIIEGTYGEIKDMLKTGDILRVPEDKIPEGKKRRDFDFRIVRRIPSQEVMDQVMENLPFSSKLASMFAKIDGHTDVFSHSWAIQSIKSGMVFVWFGECDDMPCVIKRPVEREEPEKPEEPANQGHGEPRLPEEKGFYEDADGDLWYIDPDESEPRCYWFGFSCYWFDSSCYWVDLSTDKSYGDLQRRLQLHEMSIQQAKEYVPYRRVTRIRWETN